MTPFPSNKTIIITFSLLFIWFGLKFIFKAKESFFQLNYNWENIELIEDFGVVQVDSVSYNFIDIFSKKKLQFNPSSTYKIVNNESYYFRYVYSLSNNNNYRFYGVEWITEIPKLKHQLASFSEIDLNLIQKEGVSTITIGDQYLLLNEAKYFRQFLAKRSEVNFKGKLTDVFNFPHEAINHNNSRKIINQLKDIELADNYILFFGKEDNLISKNEIKENLNKIVDVLINNKRAKNIIFITLPPSNIKEIDDFNKYFNDILKEEMESKRVIVIDSYSLFNKNINKYIRDDGFSISKDGYYLLAKKISEIYNDSK